DVTTSIIPEGDTFSYGDEPESPTIVQPVVAPAITAAESGALVTPTSTQGASTSTQTSVTSSTQSAPRYVYSGGGSTGFTGGSTQTLGCVAGGVQLTEIMYDAPGSDDGKEWIEIYNSGGSNIAVVDMKLSEGGVNHSIKSVRGSDALGPSAYAILASDGNQFIADHPEYFGQVFHSAFSFSNDGENVAVKCGDSILDSVTYSTSTGAHGDGKSLQIKNSVWRAATPTPGRATSQGQLPYVTFAHLPAYPIVGESVFFDAASSTADTGIIALYNWDFGDGMVASSTNATSTHIFMDAKSFEVRLTVTDVVGATSSKASIINISPNVPPSTNHIVISEVGVGGIRASDEFIELYNPTATATSLSGYSIQYVSGRATSTEKIRTNGAKKNFEDGAMIQPRGFYLLVNSGALSSLLDRADMIYSSFSLSGDSPGGVIFLSNTNAYISGIDDMAIVDSVAYGDAVLLGLSTSTLPIVGKSLERKASASSTIERMTRGEDRFVGNGYDTGDNKNDFIIRDIPESQNSKNYPESRAMPIEPLGPDGTTSTMGKYYAASSSIAFTWRESHDFNGATSSITYNLYAIDNASSSSIARTTSTVYFLAVPDTTHTYEFGLRACDAEGLCSATSTFSVLVRKNKAPTAAFTLDVKVPRLGNVVTFDSASSTDNDGSIDSYVWDFDDGVATSSTGAISVHAFNLVGTHNITLTVKDNEGALSSTTTLVVVAPKLDMTTSTFMLYQEDFGGGGVANIGFTGGTQFQYLGTGLSGTITSVSVYMAQMNYGGSGISLSAQLFESEALNGASRIVVASMHHGSIIANGAWVTFGLNYVLNPSKHYWLAIPSIETAYLHQNPAKSSILARYPYDARFIFWHPETFNGGSDYNGLTAENAALAYRVSGTLQ
ncbi:MAG: PKD domain-containing protein, partial [Patescibacteria group bacterium]